MSMWNLSDNSKLEASTTFEMAGGGEPIPDGTQLRAIIDEASWADWEGETYVSLRWSVVEGEFKNRKVFQKIKVYESDPKKADKARRMFAAIDANAGGQVIKLGRDPLDTDLAQHLCFKPMVIRVQIWEINDKKGNWVSMVAPSNAATPAPAANPIKEDDIPW
jgi:hypothetical protein